MDPRQALAPPWSRQILGVLTLLLVLSGMAVWQKSAEAGRLEGQMLRPVPVSYVRTPAANPPRAPRTTAKPTKVKITVPVRNVRKVATTAGNQPVGRLTAGNQVTVRRTVKGQDPYGTGERVWYQLTDGTYMWAADLQTVAAPKRPTTPKTTTPKRKTFGNAKYVKPIKGARFTSDFGARHRPKLQNGGYGSGFHQGIDLAAPMGTPIYAVTAGKVIHSGWYGSAGRCVMIRHADGTITLYAHTSRTYVRVGQTVPTGYRIAAVGSTGNSSGPHLHFGVKVHGHFINPEPWLARHGIYMR